MKKTIAFVTLALVSLLVHAQTINQMAQNQAVKECQDYQNYTHDLDLGVSQGQDANVILRYEQIKDKYDMADCIDKKTASTIAWGWVSINYKITVLEAMNIEDYATNHFPSKYMAHTSSEWKESFLYRDERQPRFTQYLFCGDTHDQLPLCP